MDSRYMQRALKLARKGVGRTAPNPAVGCVIVKDGVIVGEGWHRKAGGPHAEVHALEMAGRAARGADVYVTLEPCCHTGKTPPCSDALIAAGVRRVVAAMGDPNPQVNGGGLRALAHAGIETACGMLEAEARALNPAFIKQVTTGLPYVIYKCAMTLDGKIASAAGDSRWISCEESRRTVHRLRSRCDAVMVGVDTVIADDPQLTVRHVRGRSPLRVIVDSTLRTPESARVLSGPLGKGTILATTESNNIIHRRYEKSGAAILVCEGHDGKVDLKDMLRRLGQQGIQSLLLEGGSRLAGAALEQGLIDECLFFYAPKVVGSDGFSPFALTGITGMAQALPFKIVDVRRIASDVVVTARPEIPCLQD
nr:bifunctional diaminohydroxyphosphoribosylaminopyrimidine deaminase/5-amino-6-(5-phosphoribosylamino)uracil reductase RibD [Geobacter sp. SVR]